jgi:energy-coupling factor transporter ATP-binding protein EcfA2
MLEPRVLLADEPTGNLDSKTGDEIHELIVELNRERGMTMLVVTHNPDMAARMTKSLHMVDGRLVELAVGQALASGAAGAGNLGTPYVVDRPPELDQLARNAQGEARRSAGTRDLFFGGAWLLLGVAATVGSYLYAATAGGGKYVITYGLIATGLAQLIRGLVRRGGRS